MNGFLTINGTTVPNNGTDVEVAKLPLSEFYAVYAINVCDGTFLPQAIITHCKTPSLSRRFNLITLIEDAITDAASILNETLSLDDLEFPDGFQSAFQYADSAGTAMIVFFIAAALFLSLSTLVALVALFRTSRTTTILLFIASTVRLCFFFVFPRL